MSYKLPPGRTEQEVLAAIEKAVANLAPGFAFGYFSLEDIEQECRIFGLECLDRYDNVRPLENFVYCHIHYRLINLVRNKFKRADAPCKACHQGNPCQPDGYCKRYATWIQLNTAKANLTRPLDISSVTEDCERSMRCEPAPDEGVERRELLELIDLKLPVELRSAYNQIRAGCSVPKVMRTRVIDAVREILGCQNVDA